MENPPLFPRLAQVQPAVKSLSFLYSLWVRMVDYGYMCMIHEHTAVFSVTGPTERRLSFTAERPRRLRWTGRGKENRFFAVLLWIIFAPFFLWELNIETDSVEEVGWGKRLSRNPGNGERWSSSAWRESSLPVGTFTIKPSWQLHAQYAEFLCWKNNNKVNPQHPNSHAVIRTIKLAFYENNYTFSLSYLCHHHHHHLYSHIVM